MRKPEVDSGISEAEDRKPLSDLGKKEEKQQGRNRAIGNFFAWTIILTVTICGMIVFYAIPAILAPTLTTLLLILYVRWTER